MGRSSSPAGAILFSIAAFAFIAIPAGSPSVSAQTPPQVRVITRLVSLSVVVTDRHGQPIRGLTKDDFAIFDEGQAQKVSFFSVVTGDAPPPPAAIPQNTFTNILAQRGAAPQSVVVILFDAINSQWNSQGFALNRVRTFLRKLHPEDHVGLYVLGSQLKVLHDFTQDSSELIAAIRRYDANRGAAKQQRSNPGQDANSALDLFQEGKYNTYEYYRERENRRSVNRRFADPASLGAGPQMLANSANTQEALRAIRGHMAGVPGRKSVVWVTDTIRSDGALITNPMHSIPADYSLNLRYLARQFNDVGIAIYPVSGEGLLPVPVHWEPGGFVQDRGAIEVENQQHLTMRELAERTGGRAFVDRNDVETGVRHALEDARFSYSIAYYPDQPNPVAEFRKVRVKVKIPGATVLTRNGYYAKPDAFYASLHATITPISEEGRVRLMRGVAESPLDATAVPITAHLELIGERKPRDIAAKITCDPSALVSFADSGRWVGELDVMYMELDANDAVLNATHNEVKLDFTPEQFQKISNEGMQLNATLPSLANASVLAIILRDAASGAIGSLHIPLTHAEAAGPPK